MVGGRAVEEPTDGVRIHSLAAHYVTPLPEPQLAHLENEGNNVTLPLHEVLVYYRNVCTPTGSVSYRLKCLE